MSLLLDALKKAAEDKKKSSDASDKPAEMHADHDQDDELELELDEAAIDNDVFDSEIVKGIDEKIKDDTVENKTVEEIEPVEDLPEISDEVSKPVTEEPSLVDPISPNTTKDVVASSLEDEVVNETKVSNDQPITENIAGEAITPEPEVQLEKTKPAIRKSSFSSEQALDMMINKSREATHRKEKNIRNAGIVILILLLVVGGSYFYFDAEQQVADLEQSNKTLMNQLQQNKTITQPVAREAEPEQRVNRVSSVAEPPAIEQPVVRQVSKTVTKKPVVKPKSIQISRTVVEDPVDDLLARAYDRFNAGDFDGANRLYMRVLEREDKNRDALLGTAAVAVKQQRYEYARQKYRTLLVLDPKDSIARAGLASTESDQNNESRLKFMLREQPEASHLYFALGSLFAGEQRWPEAQQAFFSAWSGEPKNPDYAYNLGVSLDQMGKRNQAIDIYKTAIRLSNGKNVEFSVDDISARVDQLGKTKND